MSNKKSSVAKTKVNKTKDGQATKQAQATNKFLNEYLMKHEGKETVAKSKKVKVQLDSNPYLLSKVENTKETPPLTLEQKKSLEDVSKYVLSENGWIEYPIRYTGRYTGGNNFFSSIINWFKNLFK